MFGLFKEWKKFSIYPKSDKGKMKLEEVYEDVTRNKKEFQAFKDQQDLLEWVRKYGTEQAYHPNITNLIEIIGDGKIALESIPIGSIPKKHLEDFPSKPKIKATILGGKVATNSGIWSDGKVTIEERPLGIEIKYK